MLCHHKEGYGNLAEMKYITGAESEKGGTIGVFMLVKVKPKSETKVCQKWRDIWSWIFLDFYLTSAFSKGCSWETEIKSEVKNVTFEICVVSRAISQN